MHVGNCLEWIATHSSELRERQAGIGLGRKGSARVAMCPAALPPASPQECRCHSGSGQALVCGSNAAGGRERWSTVRSVAVGLLELSVVLHIGDRHLPNQHAHHLAL